MTPAAHSNGTIQLPLQETMCSTTEAEGARVLALPHAQLRMRREEREEGFVL
jgi:hypothetical protein